MAHTHRRTVSDRLKVVLVASIVTAWLVPQTGHASGVSWQSLSLDEALALAAQDGSEVLVDVYTTWCGPCQQLDAEVFPTDSVGSATDDLIAIRLNAEEGEGPAIVERYHVVGYPTVLLLQPDGVEIDRIFGFMPADEFASTVDGYQLGTGTIAQLRDQVAAEPTNLDLVYELGYRSAIRGETDQAITRLTQVIEVDADNGLGLRSQAHFVLGKYLYLRGAGDTTAALEQFAIIMDQFPSSPEASQVPFQNAIALCRSGDETAAREAFEAILAAEPDNVDAYNTVAWTCYRESFQLGWGLEVAQRGLEIDATSHSLWDTYAELQNASGDVQGAIESTQQAMTLDPDEAYYQRQLERFQSLLE